MKIFLFLMVMLLPFYAVASDAVTPVHEPVALVADDGIVDYDNAELVIDAHTVTVLQRTHSREYKTAESPVDSDSENKSQITKSACNSCYLKIEPG